MTIKAIITSFNEKIIGIVAMIVVLTIVILNSSPNNKKDGFNVISID